MKRMMLVSYLATALLTGGIVFGFEDAQAQTMADYTAMPPFIATAVPPNVLLLLDNSGSMGNSAYHDSGEAYDPAKTYNGYFDPTQCYSYGSNRFTPQGGRAATSPTCGATKPWDGNFLNWLTMERIEIAKWVMMGGKCAPRSINGNCYPGGKLTFESSDRVSAITATADGVTSVTGVRCFDRINNSFIIKNTSDCSSGTDQTLTLSADIAVEPNGVIQQVGSKARFGLMEFASNGTDPSGGKVLADVGGNLISMVNAIENTSASTWTPLAESLYEATRYFAQLPPAYANSDYSYNVTNRDPYYFRQPDWASTSQYVACCKSYVIIFTDGQPTKDTNVPATLMDWAHTVANHPPDGFTGHCTAPGGCTVDHNTEPHASHGGGLTNHNTQTDHHDNCSAYYGGSSLSNDACWGSGGHYLEDIAYYAHTTDLRQGSVPRINLDGSDATGKDLTGFQNVTVYTFFAFGSGSNILKDSAKYGGFEDKNGNNLPDLTAEWDQVNNLSGATGPDGVPDTYFESNSADDMKDRLVAAINSILRRSSSGTSASVLASSSTGEGALYQAYFFPSIVDAISGDEVKWTGYVQGLFVDAYGNLREDTLQDHKLTLTDDYIVKTRYDAATGNVLVDRFKDNDGDGKADFNADTNADGVMDTANPFDTVKLSEIKPLWEAGKQLALKDHALRKIYTWVDSNGNGLVESTEQIEFKKTPTELAKLAPYLRGQPAPSVFTKENIIDFIRGCYDASATGPCPGSSSLRNRRLTVGSGLQVWKLGDPIQSTPTLVAAPKERYDVIYGDDSYKTFFQTYRSRRQVSYVGANDGMLHAFNAGYYRRGDDASTPVVEHGRFTKNPGPDAGPDGTDSGGIPLGDELWSFIPMQLLPHLKWLTQTDYSHVYYVDLKPKVTDVRIFCDSSASPPSPAPPNCVTGQPGVSHPGGWGTVLIGGFRMGGSCGNCSTGAAPPMQVTADFSDPPDGTNETRTFYSAYFVLDITDPEATGGPKLLWSFSDADLGLTTSYPAVLRTKPACTAANCKADLSGAQWFAVFGSGPTSYEIKDNVTGIKQESKLFAIDLVVGPGVANVNVNKFVVSADTNSAWKAFMGDVATIDLDLDYRVDTAYSGSLIHDGALPWRGAMYRLTTACPGSTCTTTSWGITSGSGRAATAVLETFNALEPGPIIAAPTLTRDDSTRLWVFFGTGRFYAQIDKSSTEQQYFIGVKDRLFSGGCSAEAGCPKVMDLVDVTSAIVCSVCTGNQVTSMGSVTTLLGSDPTTSLQGLVQSKDGWFIKLTRDNAAAPRERVVSSPTLVGGIVLFPSFVPVDDICTAVGDGYLYALFYLTGSANKESVIGTDTAAGNTVVKSSVSLGQGQVAQLGVHIGAQGVDVNGTNRGGGCQSGVSIIGQSSTGAISGTCAKTGTAWSRYISWNNERL